MALRNEPYKSDTSIYDPTPFYSRREAPIKRETPDIFSNINKDQLIDLEDTLVPRKGNMNERRIDLHDLLIPKQAFLRDTIKLPERHNFVIQKLPTAEAVPVMERLYEKHSSEKLPYLKEIESYPESSRKGRIKGIPNIKNRIKNPTEDQLRAEFLTKVNEDPDENPAKFETYKEKYTAHENPRRDSQFTIFKNTRSRNTSFNINRGGIVLSDSPPNRVRIRPIIRDTDDVENNPKLKDVMEKFSDFVEKKKKTSGKGIQLKPLRIQNRVIKHKQVFNNNKYAIDTKKLKKNILDLKYVKNANHVNAFKPIEISNYLKSIIDNIIKDNYNLKTEEFNGLNTTEKRVLKRLFKFLNIQNTLLNDASTEDNNVQKNFEVAYASFLAGNNNKELINELIQYVKLALHENTINKKDGYEILNKLNK